MTKRQYVILCVLLASFIGCIAVTENDTPKVKNGKKYGVTQGLFNYNFWDYYERALSFAEGEFRKEAESDLLNALKIRKDDKRDVPTYGMHYIDYFPHRELGKVYYELGRLESARQELETSITQYPSAKAKFYLDKVLKALIEKEGKAQTSPTIEIFEPDKLRTSDNFVSVKGLVKDENYVSAMTVSEVPVFMNKSLQEDKFFYRVNLSEGENIIAVEAENVLGKKSKKALAIFLDRKGPVITIDRLQSEQHADGRQVSINGFLYDEAGVSEVSVNGEKIPIRHNTDTDFSAKISTSAEKIELTAFDSLENKTTMQIDLSSSLKAQTSVLLASLNYVAAKCNDISPPKIELTDGLTDTQTVYQEELYVNIKVTDDCMIEKLSIDAKPIARKRGEVISFGEMIKLEKGKNQISIKASDSSGRTSEKKVTVIREIPKAFQFEERLSLWVASFEPQLEKNDKTLKTARDFQAALEKAFCSKEINRFRVFKEEKKGECHIKGKIKEGLDLEFSAEMIDGETSEILVEADVYHQAKSDDILKELAEGMANILIRKYPILTGKVRQIKGNQIMIDIGRTHAENIGGKKAQLPKQLIIYRDTSMNTIIGNAKIIFVEDDKSTAKVLKLESQEVVKPADKVITK